MVTNISFLQFNFSRQTVSLNQAIHGPRGARPLQFSEQRSAFSTNTQLWFASAVLNGVLVPPSLVRHTWRCPCFSVVPEATHEASRGPLKGAVSAQKALQGSKTETRQLLGGTKEKSIIPDMID